jgi:hypothetical protein
VRILVDARLEAPEGFEPLVACLVVALFSCSYSEAIIGWCLDHDFEFVAYHEEDADEDDFLNKVGLERVREALHMHTWRGLTLSRLTAYCSCLSLNPIDKGESRGRDHHEQAAAEAKPLTMQSATEDMDALLAPAPVFDLKSALDHISMLGDMAGDGDEKKAEQFDGAFLKAVEQMRLLRGAWWSG